MELTLIKRRLWGWVLSHPSSWAAWPRGQFSGRLSGLLELFCSRKEQAVPPLKAGAFFRACTYGRPGNWLAFSLDEGHTWIGHFRFYEGRTTSYNSVEEVAPDVLLVVYDRQQLDDSGSTQWQTVGTTVTVKRR